jgi:chemotaxis protein CheD
MTSAADRQRFPSRWGGPECVKLLPGEWYVTRLDEELVTVLGSCIAVCIRDPELAVGGMNHFMLPDCESTKEPSAKYGRFAMEQLMGSLLSLGASKQRLEVKITGGGNIGFRDCLVASQNIAFVDRFLQDNGLTPKSRDVGSPYPRKVRYHPLTGRLLVCKLPQLQPDDFRIGVFSDEAD